MRLLITVLTVFFFVGCGVSKYAVVDTDYSQVNLADGVSFNEAKAMAQKHLLSLKMEEDYVIFEPQAFKEIKKVVDADKYWFISFSEANPRDIPVVYLVAITKKNGDIIYSKRYFLGKDWVLEAYFLRLKSL